MPARLAHILGPARRPAEERPSHGRRRESLLVTVVVQHLEGRNTGHSTGPQEVDGVDLPVVPPHRLDSLSFEEPDRGLLGLARDLLPHSRLRTRKRSAGDRRQDQDRRRETEDHGAQPPGGDGHEETDEGTGGKVRRQQVSRVDAAVCDRFGRGGHQPHRSGDGDEQDPRRNGPLPATTALDDPTGEEGHGCQEAEPEHAECEGPQQARRARRGIDAALGIERRDELRKRVASKVRVVLHEHPGIARRPRREVLVERLQGVLHVECEPGSRTGEKTDGEEAGLSRPKERAAPVEHDPCERREEGRERLQRRPDAQPTGEAQRERRPAGCGAAREAVSEVEGDGDEEHHEGIAVREIRPEEEAGRGEREGDERERRRGAIQEAARERQEGREERDAAEEGRDGGGAARDPGDGEDGRVEIALERAEPDPGVEDDRVSLEYPERPHGREERVRFGGPPGQREGRSEAKADPASKATALSVVQMSKRDLRSAA